MTDSPLIINQALAAVLDIIGDRWTLLILRDAFLGRSRFEQFRQNTGASRSILSQRLERLVEGDLLYRRPYGDSDSRFEYRLTAKGMELFGASLLAWQWEREWADQQDLPRGLQHALCNHPLVPVAQCRQCQLPIKLGDIHWPDPQAQVQFSEIRSLSGQRRGRSDAKGQDLALTTISALIGDRWTLLLLIAAFFGLQHYDDFHKQLGIATNILGQRLNQLVDAGIFSREQYQAHPPRHLYQLTLKGRSLYPLVMVVRQWANASLPAHQRAAQLRHAPCNHPLVLDVVCSHCRHKPWPKDVVASSS